MKTRFKNSFVLPTLAAALASTLVSQLPAQTFKTLHNFNGNDGSSPNGHLVLSGNTLYGTTFSDSTSGNGIVFAINADGTDFRILYRFTGGDDGRWPSGGLIFSSNVLYGTTIRGGTSGYGTVFAINADGTGFTNLYAFSGGSDGKEPYSVLLLESNTLYGTTHLGGDFGRGVVFGVNTDGTGSTTVHSFTGGNDGDIPFCQLLSSENNTLIGTTPGGGSSGSGEMFMVNTDGTGFTNLYMFTSIPPSPGPHTNSDGAQPYGGLISSGNALYGAAVSGGAGAAGTVFRVNSDGTGFTTLHSFAALDVHARTNIDGINPGASPSGYLTLSGNTLYGSAGAGGSSGNGTVFAVGTDGRGFAILHNFGGGSDGASPNGGLVLSSNRLYGTTFLNSNATASGNGTIFTISLPVNSPQLTIASSGQNVLLSWPTNFTSFTLQSTTNLNSPVWTTNLPAPAIINGQNTVTNPVSGAQQFFRLSQ